MDFCVTTCLVNTSYVWSLIFSTRVRPLTSALFISFSNSSAVHLSFSLVEILSVLVNLATGCYSNLCQLALEDPPNAIYLPRGKAAHEFHYGRPVTRQQILPVRLVHIGANLGELCIGSNASGDCNLRLLMDLASHLLDGIFGADGFGAAILRDIEIRFVDTSTLESRVVVGNNLSDLLGLGNVLIEIQLDKNKLGAKLFGDKAAGHATAAAKFPSHVVAGRQDAAANSERKMLELRPVKQLHSCVERIAVDVDNVLCEVAGYF
ncbi:hypothetical protein HYQ46_001342 [Verticillium longisporum]|nr:hypothetical protein HYQ46_001342 [Verticillium longisporum]